MTQALPLLAVLALAACQQVPPRTPAQAATLAACRERADEIHDRQNRGDLSRRDERDTPFASNYTSGLTSRGLAAQFERSRRIEDCTGGRVPGDASTAPGPTMSPATPALR